VCTKSTLIDKKRMLSESEMERGEKPRSDETIYLLSDGNGNLVSFQGAVQLSDIDRNQLRRPRIGASQNESKPVCVQAED
jgi:hypothetical protein